MEERTDVVFSSEANESRPANSVPILIQPSSNTYNLFDFKWLLKYISRNSKFFLALIIILNFGASLIPISYFILSAHSIDSMREYNSDKQNFIDSQISLGIKMIAFGVAYFFISVFGTVLLVKFSLKQGYLWRIKYIESLLSLKVEFYDLNQDAISGNSLNLECDSIEEALGNHLILVITGIALLPAI